MCLGIPGEVIEIRADQPDLAKVNVSGVKRLINIGLLADDPPAPGAPRVGVVAVKAPHGTALQKHNGPDPRPVKRAEALDRMNSAHDVVQYYATLYSLTISTILT